MDSAAEANSKYSLSEAAELLASDGYVLLHQLCNSDLVRSIFRVSRQKSHTIREALGSREIGIGSAAGYAEIVQRSLGRWDVPIELEEFGVDEMALPWWPLVTAVLGGDAEHSFSGVVSSEPGCTAQCWHTDSPHIAKEHLTPHAVNILMALHDIPMTMGPTECARGSHTLTNHLNNTTLVLDELIYQHASTSPAILVNGLHQSVPAGCTSAMSEGSCLVFDDRLLHRGLANQSDSARHVAYFSYRRKGYVGDTHFESKRSIFE